MPRVIGYARVSTSMQATDGFSLDTQRTHIQAVATIKGLPLIMFVDEGLSGKTMDTRPELQRALESLQHADVFCVYDLSRFARNTSDSLIMLDRVERAGAEFCSIKQNVDTSTPQGKMMFTMLSSFATYEREMIAAKVSDTMKHMSAAGTLGKKPPFGFKWVAKHQPFEPLPAQQAVIRKVHEWRQKDASMTAGLIASMLNDDPEARAAQKGRYFASAVKVWMAANDIALGPKRVRKAKRKTAVEQNPSTEAVAPV